MGRVEKLNPQLNAIIHKMYDPTRESAVNRGNHLPRL
jgi:hypothetical protein